MTKAQMDGLFLLLIGSITFVVISVYLESASSSSMVDFKSVYYSTRCLLQHCDPYRPSDVLHLYRASGEEAPTDTERDRFVIARNDYPPPEFTIIAPFALLPYGLAQVLWIALLAGGLILASFLIWNQGAYFAPELSGALLCFFLINSVTLIYSGNPAGAAISLCVMAVWCFIKDRFVLAGILCLGISLALKPHDTGLVWLYFFLVGGHYRRRALQSLAVTAALSLPTIVLITHLSPNWIWEMNSNLQAYMVHGGINDPGPAGVGHGIGGIIDLQAVISFLRDDPRVYNPVSYILCTLLLLVWGFVTLRSRPTQRRVWFALAAISALSMLPIYHRQYDAKLLLLTIPACALLWAEGGKIGRLALLINVAGFSLTGDIPRVFIIDILLKLHQSTTWMSGKLFMAVLAIPAPLMLLVMGTFYLWVYVRSASDPVLSEKH